MGHRLKLPKARRAEAFIEWAHDNPDEIASVRDALEREAVADILAAARRCDRAAKRAESQLRKQDWDTFATIAEDVRSELESCADDVDPVYHPEALGMELRLQNTGAPF